MPPLLLDRAPFIDAPEIAAAASSVPHSEFRDPHSLTSDIESFINTRDALWFKAAYSAEISADELSNLAEANKALLEMLVLTDSPRTIVLPPDRAARELQRCRVCTTFIEQAALQLRALEKVCADLA